MNPLVVLPLLAALATPPTNTPAPSSLRQSADTAELPVDPLPNQWLESGWQLLPPFSGAQRWFLTAEERRNTVAAAHLFAAAVALEHENVLGWWRQAHAHALLAEDDRNRGNASSAVEQAQLAERALASSIELDPNDPWARYSRGVLATSVGDHELAIVELDAAIALSAPRIATAGADSTEAWLAFKAREWLAEVTMRAGRFERARIELRAINSDFGENIWPLHITLAEAFQRERNFASARSEYEQILANPEFTNDPQAYALLAYLEGLCGNPAIAKQRLLESFERERVPGFYPRLWLWILVPEERATLGAELAAFLEYPPAGVSDWDTTLGSFVLGQGTPDDFLRAARGEATRRMQAGETLDDLMCEAWFYTGLRQESDALAETDPALAQPLYQRALAAYGQALSYRPIKWKWEWAYARLFASRLAQKSPGTLPTTFSLPGDQRLLLRDPTDPTRPAEEFKIVDQTWHAVATEHPVPNLDRPAQPGDLLLTHLQDQTGKLSWRLFVQP